jgi:sec-independent protein translocase protein TatB
MFDIGFTELVLIAIVSLLVIGPERLPETLRTAGLWLGRIRRSFNEVKRDIERELRTDEIRQTLHNERVLKELRETQEQLNSLKAPLDANQLLKTEEERTATQLPDAEPPATNRADKP